LPGQGQLMAVFIRWYDSWNVGNSLEDANHKHDYRLEPAINSWADWSLLLQPFSGLMLTHKLQKAFWVAFN